MAGRGSAVVRDVGEVAGSPAVVAGGSAGDIAKRRGRWPSASALSRFHRTERFPGRYKGRSERSFRKSATCGSPLIPAFPLQARRRRKSREDQAGSPPPSRHQKSPPKYAVACSIRRRTLAGRKRSGM
jgi:hypothetical protein